MRGEALRLPGSPAGMLELVEARSARLKGETGPGVAHLRDRIAQADRLLVAALSLRFYWVSRLLAVKRREGLADIDRAQELKVLREARLRAVANGLPPDMAERVLDFVIQEGKAALGLPSTSSRRSPTIPSGESQAIQDLQRPRPQARFAAPAARPRRPSSRAPRPGHKGRSSTGARH